MDPVLALAPAPLLIPLGTAFILPLVVRVSRALRAPFCILSMLLTLVALLQLAVPVFNGQTLVYWMGNWTPRAGQAIGISLTIDAWGLLIAIIVAVLGLMSLIYSIGYNHSETGQGPYYLLLMLLISALIGFCLSGDLFNQFVWLEVFSVAGFALTGFNVDRPVAVEAAFKYLITNSIASFFIAIALTLFYMQTGGLNIAHIARDWLATPAGLIAVGLMLGGYATKAALVPWHFWLPDAHTVAPAPISALFSGALIKVGIYAIGRSLLTLFPFEQGHPLQIILMVIACASIILGSIQMLQQRSIKRVLAFSSVSQIGLVALGLALGTPAGIAAAAMHALHHALVKASLFMSAGNIYRQAHVEDLDQGGGLAKQLPVTCLLMCLGLASLAGMPLLSGFISKTLLEEALHIQHLDGLVWLVIGSSLMTFAGVARVVWRVFFASSPPEHTHSVREAPLVMLLPIILLLGTSLWIGVWPDSPVARLASPVGAVLTHRDYYIGMVMEPRTLHKAALEVEAEHAPQPTDPAHWGPPLIVLLGGLALSYLLLQPAGVPLLVRRIARSIAITARHLHSGLLTDYALWNALGTGIVLLFILLATRK